MTHKPECVAITKDDDLPEISPNDCLLCITSSTAYRRGREDAAKAVEAAPAWYDEKEAKRNGGYVIPYIDVDVATAAARGDGEKE